MMQSDSIRDLKKLIQTYGRLHLAHVRAEQTFMQITRYPQLENVCSNILAFYFNTDETHGFGSLFIRSLLACIGGDTVCHTTESVERERETDKGNYIDLFIKTDKHIIAIENKIYSGVNNPLEDYAADTNRVNTSGKETIFILLTLREVKAADTPFINVTYAKLFQTIRKNLGMYLADASTKWTVYLNDFMKTIEDLQGGTALDREFIAFYNENAAQVDALLRRRKDLPKDLKAKLQAILSLTGVDRFAAEGKFFVDNNECYVEWYLTRTGQKRIGALITLEIYIDTHMCAVAVGIDGATGTQMDVLEKVLFENQLMPVRWEENKDYFLVKQFGAFEENEIVAKAFQHILSII